MDFTAACELLIHQTLPKHETDDTFLGRLKLGQPPVPGQVTALLLALTVIKSGLHSMPNMERRLAQALFLVAYESRNLFEAGRAEGVVWPPLLDEDLARIAIATYQIFADIPAAAETPPDR
ncbi:MAG: Dethiobiotin synthetase [Cyanobacteria bacterium P01_D01_bin.105]